MPKLSLSHPHRALLSFAVLAVAMLATACTATETITLTAPPVEATAPPERAAVEPTTPPLPPTATAQATPAATVVEATPEAADTNEADRVVGDDDACRYLGVDSFDDMQLELTFTADLVAQDDVTAAYVIVDPSGAPLLESSTFLEDVSPGEQVRVLVDTLEDRPSALASDDGISCAFLGLEPLDFGEPPFRPSDFDLCRLVSVDDFNDLQIEIVLTNPTGVVTELAVDYVLRGPDGVRFEDGVTYTGTEIAANAQAILDVDTFTEMPDWVDAASFTCEVLAIEGF